MNNGLYLAHKTDDGVQQLHIDEEVLWFARLNRHTRSRWEAAGKALSIRRKNAARYRRDLRAACKGAAAKVILAAGLMAATAAGWIVPGLGLPMRPPQSVSVPEDLTPSPAMWLCLSILCITTSAAATPAQPRRSATP